jgi:RNA:NAD 2'-phosphotransferase (TPT1/KptA family)
MNHFATFLQEAEKKTVLLYHGTSQERANHIATEGIKLGALRMVWATESYAAAELFAKHLSYPDPTRVAVVVIAAPKGSFLFEKPLSRSVPNIIGKRTVRFVQPIPPEWIQRIDRLA